jgi:hypothetical protein
MVKKTLIAASLAALVIGVSGPASADPKFLEEYGEIFGGRTVLGSAADSGRANNALQGAESKVESPTSRILASPFYRTTDIGPLDVDMYGVGLLYASGGTTPWQVGGNFYNTNVDGLGIDDDFFSWDIYGKVQVLNPANASTPVVSIYGRYMDIDDLGSRWDIGLAADQRITDEIYGTVNLGWGNVDPDGAGGDTDDFIAGLGVTYRPRSMPKLSLSFNFVFDNDVDGDDFWSIGAIYAVSRDWLVRVGGGEDSTFFVNIIGKWDR